MRRFVILVLLTASLVSCRSGNSGNMEKYYLYVGAYTSDSSEGVAIYTFDTSTGALKYIKTISDVRNPSYLAINEKAGLLVAVNELAEYQGEPSGAVSSFRINRDSGDLALINQVSSGGRAPCYVSIDKDARYCYLANYSGGNVAMIRISKAGKLEDDYWLEKHEGSGVVTGRQEAPHAHAMVLDPNEQFAMAVDLGIDKVISYRIDRKKGELMKENVFETKAGAGPRHLEFHRNAKQVFIINELNSSITSCSYNSKTGALTEITTVSTLPPDFVGENSCADIHVSVDGRFLYGSNRGHDSIVVFGIDRENGQMTLVSHHSTKGKTPRNFMIDPTGQFLLVANQNSNNIVVFRIDEVSGKLIETDISVITPKPVCLKMMFAKD